MWVSEVGVSSFGAEEIQELGLARTAQLLIGRTARIHWYSLDDRPHTWEVATRHKEAEGAASYRHSHMGLMGLLRADGTPKRAARLFAEYTPDLGVC